MPYRIEGDETGIVATSDLPQAQLTVRRKITLSDADVLFTETVENVSATDRPVAWTQHVTMGPPFLEKGATHFRVSGRRSKVFEEDFAGEFGFQTPGAEFDWPFVPLKDGGVQDLRVLTNAPASGAFTTTLMDPGREDAFFLAHTPSTGILFGYIWKQRIFRGWECGRKTLPGHRRHGIARP